ncbi:MAG: yagR [Labilithrix sp.]|nr:yagR [Labilithrix sp.]
MSTINVGKGIDRLDARLKVTGKATYAAEYEVANVAYAVIVGGVGGKGTIKSIDASAAEKAPGVLAVLTHLNAPKLPGAKEKGDRVDRLLQVLQDGETLYDDQPVALVVADSLERAHAAAGLVRVDLTLAAGTAISMEAERPRAFAPENVNEKATDTSKGDFDKAFADAKVKVEQTYTTPATHHNPMELHATTAVWQGDDHLTVYDATQSVFGVRKKLAKVFAIAPDNVRVISHYLGGGFGSKGSVWSHVVLAAMGAKMTKRPVKLVVTRPQMFAFVGHRPSTSQTIRIGADAGGKILALSHETLSYTSRFDEFMEPSAMQTRMLYAADNLKTQHRLVRLDVPTPTFTRAPGEATGTFALESALDELAYATGKDPLQVRLDNHADKEPGEGKPFSSKELKACYKQASEKFGWNRRKKEPRTMRDGRWLVGYGMATATYPANLRAASAAVRLRPDGTALVQAGTQDLGTGTYTVMTQIAADALGLPMDKVTFELGDTKLPEAPGSGGSQTASTVGSAVKGACAVARAALFALASNDAASPLHGLKVEDLELADGMVAGTRDRTKKEAFGELVKRSGQPELLAKYDAKPKDERKEYACHSHGAHFVEVRVDESTGELRVARIVSAFAAGKILNAKTARSQYIGGIVWGLGLALLEESHRDARSGRVVNHELQDYLVPVNLDVPPIDVIMVPENDAIVNDIGTKGIGEIGITGLAAAVANAVYHATGKRIRELPITLDKVMGAGDELPQKR